MKFLCGLLVAGLAAGGTMTAQGSGLSADERAAWLGLLAVVELLPGVLDAQLRVRQVFVEGEAIELAHADRGA